LANCPIAAGGRWREALRRSLFAPRPALDFALGGVVPVAGGQQEIHPMKVAVRLIVVAVLLFVGYMVVQGRRAAALNNEATALLGENRFQEAAAKLEAARRMAPKNANVWRNLGVAQEGLGRDDQALHSFTTAMRLSDGKMEDVRVALERLQDNQRLRSAARARVEKMKAGGWVDDTATFELTTQMASTSFHVGNYKHALLLYERALFKQPENIELMRMIEELDRRIAGNLP